MSEPRRVLLVDDDPDFLRLLSLRLEREGYRVTAVDGADEALARLLAADPPHAVLTDLRMDGKDGIELLQAIHQRHPSLPVLIITAHGTIPEAVHATQRGAVGFITKPVDKDDLLAKLERAIGTYASGGNGSETPGFLTQNATVQAILADAARAAGSESAILIHGETGSGKEVLARFIHAHSPRADGPWVTVNCAAIPEDLLESELFGHVKGAFTGAGTDRQGLVRAANGGTLFLDEIGDMPLALQTKLLRMLEEHEVRPVGATREERVDVRVISATHRDLAQAIGDGAFRADLYYRLNVLPLTLPPLRQRREDIPLLAQRFLDQFGGADNRKVYAPDAMALLIRADWPGNVRQLRNVVERNVALTPGVVIPPGQVTAALGDDVPALPSFDEARDAFTREYLMQLLKITGGNVSQAARLAQRNRTDFYKLLQRHSIERDQLPDEGD